MEKEEIICYPANKSKNGTWKIKKDGIKKGGAWGDVFQVCKEKNCDYVIKIIKNYFYHEKTKKEFEKSFKHEICYQKICSENGLCKPVEDWWMCERGETGVIITPILKETLTERILRDKKDENIADIINILTKTVDIIHKLHLIGISHGDLHGSNVMLDNKDNPYFIDMGSSHFVIIADDVWSDYFIFSSLIYSGELSIIFNTKWGGIPIEKIEDIVYKKVKDIIENIRTENI